MIVEQKRWTEKKGWEILKAVDFPSPPQLVLAFGGRTTVEKAEKFDEIKSFYPDSQIIVCSTAGEICNDRVEDNSISLVAVCLEKTKIYIAETDVSDSSESHSAGERLAEKLTNNTDLAHVMVFSDGLKVNGTSLVSGLSSKLGSSVSVTGGLVGDGADFKQTVLGLNSPPTSGKVVAVGFCGKDIRFGYGSLGGWDTFGPERLITKSEENVLYELDGKSALGLYKDYLGDQAAELPGSGLLFPVGLRLKNPDGAEVEIVRTLLAVNEQDQSMTFAGDMPQGVYAKLMKANFDRLVDGAEGAASMAIRPLDQIEPDLAILISCVGRKLVLKERVEEEIEAARSALGNEAVITGFYSYGELCPTSPTEKQCQLHNQTMTITAIKEL